MTTSESAKPVGWIDEFGNVFPLGAYRPPGNVVHDGYKTNWKHVYAAPQPQAPSATSDDMRAALADARNSALEEAAQVCDDRFWDRMNCATAIRALRTNSEK